MKNLYLPLTVSLVLVLTGVSRADSYDSETATIQKCKSSSKCANVMIEKKTYTVPVAFDDGASWDNVKDHYELSGNSVAALKGGHAKLKVGSDGTASWTK